MSTPSSYLSFNEDITPHSTPFALYAEIERLRALCELRQQQHRATCAELSAEKAAHSDTYYRLRALEDKIAGLVRASEPGPS